MTPTAQLKGKRALITGGSSGIGFEIAKRFAEEGAQVGLVGTDANKVRRAAEIIRAANGAAIPVVGDVGNFAGCSEIVATVERSIGAIDILVNSAGVWFPTPTGELAEVDVDRMIAVNLKGPLGMINAVAPGMKERRSGFIVNLASVAGIAAAPDYSLYCGVKAAIVMMTKVFALDLAPYDIVVNAIAPGNTETPMNAHIRNSPEFSERRAWIDRVTPSNRSFTPAGEIAEAALFLVNGRVRAAHGTTIVLDEGKSAGMPAK